MTQASRWATLAALALTMSASAVAEDAERGFDCEGPSGRVTQNSLPATLPVTISGVLQALKIGRGSYIPWAGASIESADGKKGIALLLVHNGWSGGKLTPTVYGMADSSLPILFDKVPKAEPIPFSLSLSASGRAAASVAGKTVTFAAKPMDSAKVVLFCQTGHFKFSDVKFSTSN